MVRRLLLLLLLSALGIGSIHGQDKITLDGYLSDMFTTYHISDQWLWENSLHNRLNLKVYPSNWLSGTIQVRSRCHCRKYHPEIPRLCRRIGWRPGLAGYVFCRRW